MNKKKPKNLILGFLDSGGEGFEPTRAKTPTNHKMVSLLSQA